MNFLTHAKELTLLGKSLSEFVVGAEGNISKRVDNKFLIKASGSSLKKLKKQDFVLCDLSCKQLNNFKKKSSIETGFHSWIYQNSNYKVIAHTHPENCLKILCSSDTEINKFANERLFPDQVVYNGTKSCIIPYAHPGEDLMEEIKKNVDKFIKEEGTFPEIFLLKNHGIICCSNSIKSALITTEICEKAAKIFAQLSCFKKMNFLSKGEINKIILDKKEIYRKNENNLR